MKYTNWWTKIPEDKWEEVDEFGDMFFENCNWSRNNNTNQHIYWEEGHSTPTLGIGNSPYQQGFIEIPWEEFERSFLMKIIDYQIY